MTDLIARVEVAEITATIEAPELKAKVGFTSPVQPDYFAWRQEYFDPYFHLPLNDPPGSTVAKALAGPDGVHGPGAIVGAPGIIQPTDRYTAVRYVDSDGSTTVGDENTFRFLHEDQNFTIAFWVRYEGESSWAIATSNRSNARRGVNFQFRLDANTAIGFRYKTGSTIRTTSLFVGYALNTSGNTLGGVSHIVATGRRVGSELGEFILYVNGQAVGRSFPDAPTESPQEFPLRLDNGFTGTLQGLLIDTRPWTPEEVQMDYLRGMGVWE